MARLLLEDAEDVLVPEESEILIAQSDVVPAVLRQQHFIVRLHAHRQQRAVLVATPRPDRDDHPLVELRLRRVGQQHATDRLGRRLDALDQHAVEQRDQPARSLCARTPRSVTRGRAQALVAHTIWTASIVPKALVTWQPPCTRSYRAPCKSA